MRQGETGVDVAKIIEDLYEGTLDPVAWDRAILGVADTVRASGAMLFAFNPSNLAILRDENHRVDPQTVRDYARHWTYEDDRLRFFLNVPAGQPVTEVSLAIPDLKRSAIIEVRFIPEGPGMTRVELEHRNFERMAAPGGEKMRNEVDRGWPTITQLFADEISREEGST
jgi:hypothetical protein